MNACADRLTKHVPGWKQGKPLIRGSCFESYVHESADERYKTRTDWPLNCINWKQAARELKRDYLAIELGGDTFWVNSQPIPKHTGRMLKPSRLAGFGVGAAGILLLCLMWGLMIIGGATVYDKYLSEYLGDSAQGEEASYSSRLKQPK